MLIKMVFSSKQNKQTKSKKNIKINSFCKISFLIEVEIELEDQLDSFGHFSQVHTFH